MLLAEGAANATWLQHAVASVRGLAAAACFCASSPSAAGEAEAALAPSAEAGFSATVHRVVPSDDASYRTACLRACVGAGVPAGPAACAAGRPPLYALPLEAGSLLELQPGTALDDTTHAGVPPAARRGVAAALAAALRRSSEGYLLWVSLDDLEHATLPLLLRADVSWSYDDAGRAWAGGAAPEVLHTSAFKLRITQVDRLLALRARHIANAAHFAARAAANASDTDAAFYQAHSLKDAGLFSHALPAFERWIALAAATPAAARSREVREQMFLSHMLRGRIYAARGSIDNATTSYMEAVAAMPTRRAEALTELANILRLAGRLARALPYARAAADAAQEGQPVDGGLFLATAPYDHSALLEVALSAYAADDVDALTAGVRALTALLGKAHIARAYWLASFDNAGAYIAKLQSRRDAGELLPAETHAAVDALRAAMQPREPSCDVERVGLHGAPPDAADGTSCGAGSILGALFADVAVIAMPSRHLHVTRFLTSMGCSRYLRFPAVTHLTPLELRRDHNPRLRNGELRLLQAHACAAAHAAALPLRSPPLAVFEDDVAPVPPAALPAVRHILTRLVGAAPADADALFMGRCPCDAAAPGELPDAVVPAGFFQCAHAYALTPAGGAKLRAALQRSAFADPLDVALERMAASGQLRAYTNAGPSAFSQQQLVGALNGEYGKGAAQCRLPPLTVGVDGWPAPAVPVLKLAVAGGWSSAQVTADTMWLLQHVLQNVTGRAVELVPLAHAAAADVILASVFVDSRAELEALHAAHGARAVFIFVVGENTHERGSPFRDQLVPLADVSLGHRTDLAARSYLRFPWHLTTALVRRSASTALDAVGFHPALLRRADADAWAARPGFALFINAHDAPPRRELVALAAALGSVASPGRALNNMRWPQGVANDVDGKLELLSRHRFALCPENSVSPDGGYVTEKLPQAHLEGAVPVYWGDAPRADAGVWNMRRVLLYANGSSNAALMEAMVRLQGDAAFRDEWFSQPVLAAGAEEWLARFLRQLAAHMRRALVAKGIAVLET